MHRSTLVKAGGSVPVTRTCEVLLCIVQIITQIFETTFCKNMFLTSITSQDDAMNGHAERD